MLGCTNPPTVPCRPGCPGWVVEHGKYLQACAACDHFPANDADWVIVHLGECAWCCDQSMAQGAIEPLAVLFNGLEFHQEPEGWRAEVNIGARGRNSAVLSTAVYPTREQARDVGKAWLKRLRGWLP